MTKEKDYSEDSNNFYINEQNKKKKKELEEKYGMLSFNGSSEASPEVMNNFLNYIQQFEENYEKAETKKIREILGNPIFNKIDKIDPQNIENEIDLVLEKYAAKNFKVDIIEFDDVKPEDFYKFLTEELIEHMIDFINIPGVNTNFIYEDFHPNMKLNIKDCTRYFHWGLKEKDKQNTLLWLAEENVKLNDKDYSPEEFAEKLFEFFPDNIVETDIKFNEIDINIFSAQIELTIKFKINNFHKSNIYDIDIKFNKIDSDYMEVKSINIKSNQDNI